MRTTTIRGFHILSATQASAWIPIDCDRAEAAGREVLGAVSFRAADGWHEDALVREATRHFGVPCVPWCPGWDDDDFDWAAIEDRDGFITVPVVAQNTAPIDCNAPSAPPWQRLKLNKQPPAWLQWEDGTSAIRDPRPDGWNRDQCMEFARRLAACWNAMVGVSTDEIERTAEAQRPVAGALP
jgi:hypothetical protein